VMKKSSHFRPLLVKRAVRRNATTAKASTMETQWFMTG
jgi:hypothetical protein